MRPELQDQPALPAALDTARLELRCFNLEDAEELHDALTESIVELRQYLWHVPWIAQEQTLCAAQIRCKDARENFLSGEDFAYLAFAKSTKRLIASVGLHRTDWAQRRSEVGYWVRSSEAGRGYATEMVNAVAALALETLGITRLDLVTDEQNTGSRRVAKRCGFSLDCSAPQTDAHEDGVERYNCIYFKSYQGVERVVEEKGRDGTQA